MATISDERKRSKRRGAEPADGEASLTSSRAESVEDSAWVSGPAPTRVGGFVVERELARGGMGIVYLARDQRLGRPVALKALPESFAGDAVRRLRLEREARLLALVNHPGVATIHGLEDAEGRTFLVMEYVEGDTLKQALVRERMTVKAALLTCVQVAAAVEAAHERGVVHRDLKPENIKVTPSGHLKVLDFGLATTLGQEDEDSASDVAVLDDEDERELTRSGVVLGTPGYMSPEQVRGEPADRRADTWALGCITFECLAGQRTWGRGPARARLQATRWHEPDWSLLPKEVPEGVVAALRSCLEKDLPRRLARAGELKAALEAGIAELDGRATGVRAEARRGNLPRQLTSFLGREAGLASLASRLETPGLVTLMGPGGTGKTRLAVEAARRGEAAIDGGAWFVDLAPVASGVVAAVAAAMGVTESPGVPLQAQVEAHVGSRRVLVILDNCEHLVEEAAERAAELVTRCAGLTVLATSREALGVPGETVIEVVPLGVPGAGVVTVEEAAQHDAVRLWVERAKAADATFELGVDNVSAISEACRLLDGLPLAIELAAARTRSVPAERVVALLASGGDVGGGRRGGPARHRTLRGLIEWSHGLLSAQEAAAYRRLGVFAGGVPVEAVEAVVAGGEIEEREVIDLVARLVEKSLVAVESRGGEARYRLLETVKAHAREKLEEAGEGDATRLRHVRWAQREAARLLKHLEGADALKWSERAGDLLDEAKAVVAWAPGAGEGDAALEVATAWGRGLLWRGVAKASRDLILTGLRLTAAHPAGAARCRALSSAARAAMACGDPLEASELSVDARTAARALGLRDEVSWATATRTIALLAAGSLGDAEAEVRTLDGRDDLAPRPLQLLVWRARAFVHSAAGRHVEAALIARRVVEQLLPSDRLMDVANAHETLAMVLRSDGMAALNSARHALAVCRRLGSRNGELTLLLLVGVIEFAAEDVDAAHGHWSECLRVAETCGDTSKAAKALNNLGTIACRRGAWAEARQRYTEALRLRASSKNHLSKLTCLANIADCHLHAGSDVEAAVLLFAVSHLVGVGRAGMDPTVCAELEGNLASLPARLPAAGLVAARDEAGRLDLEAVVLRALTAPPPSEEGP